MTFRPQRLLPALALGCVAGLWAACGGVSAFGENFRFSVRLHDATGNAVEDIKIQLHVPLNGIFIEAASKRAATNIEFSVPQESWGEIDILDLDERPIRHLMAGQFAAGLHTLKFDALTDSGLTLDGTVPFYVRGRFWTEEGGEPLWTGTSTCVLYSGPDLARLPVLGKTGSDGRMKTEDGDLFPFLWELPTLQARTAEGLPAGEFTISNIVELYMTDESTGEMQVELVDVESWGAQEVFEWDPLPPPAASGEVREAVVQKLDVVPVGGVEWQINVCLPNPFN